MADIIQLRGDTAANWASVNPILAHRELGLDLDTYQFKVGDGILPWNDLEYYLTGPSGPQGPPGISDQVFNEIPTGVKDGINKIFTTENNFVARSTRVFKNMLRLTIDQDYTETGSNEFNILCTLRSTDTLIIDYAIQTTQI